MNAPPAAPPPQHAPAPAVGPPTPRRRQARAVATRRAILDAALTEFAAHGFEGASTRSIATNAGTHQPQINYHFSSKDDLWKAAVDHLFERLDEMVHDGLVDADPSADDRTQLAQTIRAFVRAAASLPELNRIMVQEATIDSDRLSWIVERHTRERFERLADDWRRLREAGEVADIDEVVLYYSVIGAASLAYVNAPEARLLGHDTLAESFIDAHADAIVAAFIGPGV